MRTEPNPSVMASRDRPRPDDTQHPGLKRRARFRRRKHVPFEASPVAVDEDAGVGRQSAQAKSPIDGVLRLLRRLRSGGRTGHYSFHLETALHSSEAAMDRFIRNANIEHYRRQIAISEADPARYKRGTKCCCSCLPTNWRRKHSGKQASWLI